MLTEHKGTTKDTTGCEFDYTCYTQKEHYIDFSQDGWPTVESVDRDYFVFDGKGTGAANVLAKAKTLKDLKVKMAQL